MMSLKLIILLIFLSFNNAIANTNGVYFKINIENKSLIKIEKLKKTTYFSLHHSIDGFEVDCNKKYIALWGKPTKLNANNPQDSEISLINLTSFKIIKMNAISKGIYGFKYAKNNDYGVVESDLLYSVNLASGLLKKLDPNADINMIFEFEKCDIFSQKSYPKP